LRCAQRKCGESKDAVLREKMSDRVIRASEIGQYDFCAKAWWLASIEGVPPSNVGELQSGAAAHAEHGRQVRRAAQLQLMAIGLVMLGVIVLVLTVLAR
jgi:hypothetical protein